MLDDDSAKLPSCWEVVEGRPSREVDEVGCGSTDVVSTKEVTVVWCSLEMEVDGCGSMGTGSEVDIKSESEVCSAKSRSFSIINTYLRFKVLNNQFASFILS